jgi:hypothetical protein
MSPRWRTCRRALPERVNRGRRTLRSADFAPSVPPHPAGPDFTKETLA